MISTPCARIWNFQSIHLGKDRPTSTTEILGAGSGLSFSCNRKGSCSWVMVECCEYGEIIPPGRLPTTYIYRPLSKITIARLRCLSLSSACSFRQIETPFHAWRGLDLRSPGVCRSIAPPALHWLELISSSTLPPAYCST